MKIQKNKISLIPIINDKAELARNIAGPFIIKDQLDISDLDKFNSVIYMVLDNDEDIIYIGKQQRVNGTFKDRFNEHKNKRNDFGLWTKIYLIELTELGGLLITKLEAELIKFFQPELNKIHTILQPPPSITR